MWLQNGIIFVGLFLVLPSSAAPGKPSFDCGRAQSPVEVAICKHPKLAALDRAVYGAYKSALRRLHKDKDAQKALRDEQRWFLKDREEARQREDIGRTTDFGGLDDFMEWRRKKLDQIVHPSSGYEGLWINGHGEVRVRRRPDGAFAVRSAAGEWITARWVCEYEGKGHLQGEHIAVSTDAPDEDYSLKFKRTGSVLLIFETSRSGTPSSSPYCGSGGRLSGVYFGTKTAPRRAGSE